MKKYVFLIVSFVLLTCSSSTELNKNKVSLKNNLESNNRDGKVVTIIIPGPICQANLNLFDEGYCDGVVSCLSYFGRITGLCQNGIGVCCVVTSECGRRIPNRVAYFTNENKGILGNLFEPIPCRATVVRFDESITQLRLDFITFDLQQPDANGNCQGENFTITGNNPTPVVPPLCGINTGNHVYVRFNAAGGPITLTANLDPGSTSSFVIKISQLSDAEAAAAPAGCLQYFPAVTGEILSFNFNGNQLLNFGYTFCVASGTTTVTWTASDFVIGVVPADLTCASSDHLLFGVSALITSNVPPTPVNRVCDFPTGRTIRATSTSVNFVSMPNVQFGQKFRLSYTAS